MDTATAAPSTETKGATTGADLLDSPAVRKAKAKLASAKKAKKSSGKKAPAKKSKKAKAKKAAKAAVKKAAKKVAKKAKAAKVTKRKRVGPHVTFVRAGDKLKNRLVKFLKTPRTLRELAKLMKVGKSMAQQYIVSLKAAGVKVKRDESKRQGKRGPKAMTFAV
jgi:hypothetical protein